MEITNVKDLEKLLKMCRKQGITELTMQGMSFKFGDLPKENGEEEEQIAAPPGISDEEMAFYSALPDPLTGAN